MGAGAVVIAPAFSFRASAQSSSTTTVLGLTKEGYVHFPEKVGGVSLTTMQRKTLGRVGTQIAAQASSRAAAEATLTAVTRTAMTGSMKFGLVGMAAAAVIGGIYFLICQAVRREALGSPYRAMLLTILRNPAGVIPMALR
jgi:hypothetical protein